VAELVKNCPLCEEKGFHLFDRRQFRGFEVVNQICDNCGLVFQSPRMTEAELNGFYAREYRDLYQGAEGPTPKDLLIQNGRADSLIAFLNDQVIVPSRYLDTGCSAGILLKRFEKQYACNVTGVEPGDAYRNHVLKQGLKVYSSLDDLAQVHEGRFDLISMAHVLEHIPNPVEYLSDLRTRYLTPDGRLLIEVPNLYTHDSFEIAHSISFSSHTLQETLKKAGFEIVATKKHGQPRSELLTLYLTFLAQPSEDNISSYQVHPEQNVPLKRKLGMFWRHILERLIPHRTWITLGKSARRTTCV